MPKSSENTEINELILKSHEEERELMQESIDEWREGYWLACEDIQGLEEEVESLRQHEAAFNRIEIDLGKVRRAIGEIAYNKIINSKD